jgi:DNA invertase Pin-like site-specific DNA recombinase
MITMVSLFAEIELDFISELTKEELAIARAEGKFLGRHKGSLGKFQLNRRYLKDTLCVFIVIVPQFS